MSERKIDKELLDEPETPEQKPSRYEIDQKVLIDTFKQSHMIFALNYLRNGLSKKEAFMQLLKHKFSKKGLKAGEIVKAFHDLRMIKKITVKIGDEIEEYYVLVRDFVIYKKPPVQMMSQMHVNQKLPNNIASQIKSDIEDIFKNLKDLNVKFDEYFELYSTPGIEILIGLLSENPIPLHDDEFIKETNEKVDSKFTELSETLKSKGLAGTIEDSKRKETWLYLRYEYEIEQVYPEFIIESINRNMRDGNLQKEIAIAALKELKLAYFELEAPLELEKKLNQIEAIKKDIETYTADPKKKNEKQIKKFQETILKIYEELGDVKRYNEYLEEIQKTKNA